MRLRLSTALAALIGALVLGIVIAEVARAETACHLEQSQPGTAQLVPSGLEPLGHNKFYDLVVLGPAKQFVNEGIRNPGEEVPLPFNTRFGAGTYEGQVWEAHFINKGKQFPPAAEHDRKLAACTAALT